MRYFLLLILICLSATLHAKEYRTSPAFVPIITNQICVNSDGNDIACYPTAGANDPVNVVYECPLAGDATVPLHINTGVSNPGPGVTVLITKNPGEAANVVGYYDFESRGTQQNVGFIRTFYFVTRNPSRRLDSKELPCVCHATDVEAATGCPDFLPPLPVNPNDAFIPGPMRQVQVIADDATASFNIPPVDYKITLCGNTTPLRAPLAPGNGIAFLQNLATGSRTVVRYDNRTYNVNAGGVGVDVLKLFADGMLVDALDVFASDFEGCFEYIAGFPPPPSR